MKPAQRQLLDTTIAQMGSAKEHYLALAKAVEAMKQAFGSDEEAPPSPVTKPYVAPRAPKITPVREDASDKPSLINGILQVMGDEVVGAGEILGRLEGLGWSPNSNNPRQYVAITLSNLRKDGRIERVEHGLYKKTSK